jgi:hypothetical protein
MWSTLASLSVAVAVAVAVATRYSQQPSRDRTIRKTVACVMKEIPRDLPAKALLFEFLGTRVSCTKGPGTAALFFLFQPSILFVHRLRARRTTSGATTSGATTTMAAPVSAAAIIHRWQGSGYRPRGRHEERIFLHVVRVKLQSSHCEPKLTVSSKRGLAPRQVAPVFDLFRTRRAPFPSQ